MNRKFAATLLSVVFLLSVLTACSSTGTGTQSSAPQNVPGQQNTSDTSNPFTPLVVGYLPFSEKFSPFFSDSSYDSDVVDMVHLSLLTTDRMGKIIYHAIEGETVPYNGTDYTYRGIADIDVKTDENEAFTVYTIRIRDDLVFSDGVPITADDLIFNYYVLADPSYTGSSTLYSVPILGIQEYREETETKSIKGIKRIDDYTVTITTEGFDASAIYKIAGISVAPLHYYGNRSSYNYTAEQYGFPKGDLSTVDAKTAKPLGAGPYVFDRYENRVVYFTANKNYYKGEPHISFVQFKETDESDKIAGVGTGTIDITDPAGSLSSFQEIRSYHANGELSGDKILTSTVSNLGYGYIGINAETVKVGTDKDSPESKALRKAFATMFAVYRDLAIGSYYGESAKVIEYPISDTSWAAPRPTDDGYEESFSRDLNGQPLYTTEMSDEMRYQTAREAAKNNLIAAGYTYDESIKQFTAAPEGAKLSYQIIIPAQGSGNHPVFALLEYVRTEFQKMGITLTIYDPSDPNELWNMLDTGKQEMWTAAWSASVDPDLYQTFHSSNIPGKGGTNSNHYHIDDTELDQLILDARRSDDTSFRKVAYRACFDIILDWAVEIPVYQRQNCLIFSAERIQTDTITPDITTYWNWTREIEKLKMR